MEAYLCRCMEAYLRRCMDGVPVQVTEQKLHCILVGFGQLLDQLLHCVNFVFGFFDPWLEKQQYLNMCMVM